MTFHAALVQATDRLAACEMENARLREALARQHLPAGRGGDVAVRIADRDRMWELSHELMLVAQEDGTITAANPAWETLLGYDEASLVGTPLLTLVHPDDVEMTARHVAALATGHSVASCENRYRHRDGSYRTLSWTAVPADGLIHGVARDVTAERAHAAARREAEDQLRQAQRMEAVGQLTGGVAHDFNNLLTIIRSSADLLRRPDLREDRRRRYLDAIAETADRAARLTSQLLAFSRRQALKPEMFDMAEQLRAAGDMLRTLLGARVAVDLRLPAAPCYVEADRAQFEAALVNIAANARDAMEGEGTLVIAVEPVSAKPPLRGHAATAGAFVALVVEDSGPGIAPDRVAQVFEPFFTTKDVGRGTGLGLSQVYGFAKQSGGDVGVESRPGHGARFTLYLPQARIAQGTRPHASSPSPAPSLPGGRRVLVVEDNVDVGTFSTRLLEDLGYETRWATDAAGALAMLEAGTPFDAVFSDIVMPGMSGLELGETIRRRWPDLPVILTSGYSHGLAEEGCHGFELIQKPYAVEELSRVLQRIVPLGRAPG